MQFPEDRAGCIFSARIEGSKVKVSDWLDKREERNCEGRGERESKGEIEQARETGGLGLPPPS